MAIGSKVKSGNWSGCSIHSYNNGVVYIEAEYGGTGLNIPLDSSTLAKAPKLIDKKEKKVGLLRKTYYYCNLTFKDGGKSTVKLSERKYYSVMGEF